MNEENTVEVSFTSKLIGSLIAIVFWGSLLGLTPKMMEMAADSMDRGITSYSAFTKQMVGTDKSWTKK